MYAISLYRYDVCIYKKDFFVRETSRFLALYFFHHSLCFLGANYCNLFYDCSSFRSLGEVSGRLGEFSLAFLIAVG